MRPSRRRRLGVAVAGLVLLGGALGAGCHVAEERWLGRIASGVPAVSAGVPLTAERARVEPGRLAVLAGRVDDPGRTRLDAWREQVLALVRLQGRLRVRLRGAELRGRDALYRLDVTGEKSEAGVVTVALTLAPAGQPPALRADVRATATAGGDVDGARMDARARYEGGAFDAEITAAQVSAAAVWRRLGLGAPPLPLTAGAVRARVTGATDAGVVSADVDAAVDRIEASSLAVPVDATLAAAVRLVRAEGGLRPGPVERAAVTLLSGGAPLATLGARSRGATVWPILVEAAVPDAAAVAPLLGPAAKLAGSGRVTGQIDGAGTPTFRGRLDADLAAAELTLPTPVVLTAVRADGVPVYWNAGGVEQPGAVSVARLVAHGLTVEDLASSATLIDGLVRLPDLRYRHHEGHGSGWAEIALGGATPVRARVEGEDVDLAAVVRDTGSTVAQVTGRVRYTGSLQRLRGRGVDAVVELRSQERGEIGIEALERLLASPAVEVESTGLLRQTLENLRVFEYESLDGVLRATDGQGTVDLSITGRRRLGLFPGPVQAINFRNVPLDVLSRTLDRGTSR
jgi:hypothetical protein